MAAIPFRFVGILALSAVFGPAILHAQPETVTWVSHLGVWDGNWTDVDHWNPHPPDSDDHAIIMDNDNTFTVELNVTRPIGGLTLGGGANATQTLLIRSQTPGGAALTVTEGFTNRGVIELARVGTMPPAGLCRLTVSNGSLVNAGVIFVPPGPPDLPRRLNLALDNQQTLTVNGQCVLDRSGAQHANSGTITITGMNANLRILQTGTTPSITTRGTIDTGTAGGPTTPTRLTIAGGEMICDSNNSLSGAGALELDEFAHLIVTGTFAAGDATTLDCPIIGTGDIVVDRGATLTLTDGCLVNLSGQITGGCLTYSPAWGTLNVRGSVRMKTGSRIENTHLEINNDSTAISCGNLIGGRVYIDEPATLSCNEIEAFGGMPLVFEPDLLTLDRNRLTIRITPVLHPGRGELLELQSLDYNCDPSIPPDEFGLIQCSTSEGYDIDPFVIDKLIVSAGARVELANRFPPPGGPPLGPAAYVRELVLNDNAVVNTRYQRLYYQTRSDGTNVQEVAAPLLGFSLGVITLESDCEFALRVRPTLPSDGGRALRTNDLPGDSSNGVMRMQTLTEASVGATGQFDAASSDKVVIAFEYLFDGNPQSELAVSLSDDPFVGGGQLVARLRPPPPGAPGSIGSARLATFRQVVPRGTLNLTRGTYVELRLIRQLGTGSANIWIDDWDPWVECSGECGDVDGLGEFTDSDYLTVLGMYGQTLDLSAEGTIRTCVDSGLNSDGHADMSDLLAWDCYRYDPSIGCLEGNGHPRGGVPVDVPDGVLVVAGKQVGVGANFRRLNDRLYFVDLDGTYTCTSTDPASPSGSHGFSADGRLVVDGDDAIFQIHGVEGIIRLDDAISIVPPQVRMSDLANRVIYVGLDSAGDPNDPYPVGQPLLDAAFPEGSTNQIYVAPVLVRVDDDPRCPISQGYPDPASHYYRAAARLNLIAGSPPSYSVDALFGIDPYCDDRRDAGHPTDPISETLRSTEDRSRPREIELDRHGNLFILSSSALNDNEWLVIYPATASGVPGSLHLPPVKLRELLPDGTTTGPLGACAMFVSRNAGSPAEDKLFVAASRYQDTADPDHCLLYRVSINRTDPGNPNAVTSITADGTIAIEGMSQISAIVEKTESDPDLNRLWVIGFTTPPEVLDQDYVVNPNADLFTSTSMAIVSVGASSGTATVILPCGVPTPDDDLAFPISAVFSTPAVAPCPDFDGNGQVELTDLAILLSNFGMLSGATFADGDTNGDGAVDLGDLAFLLSNFGNHCL